MNLLVANTSNRDQNFCEQKSISGGWDEYQSDQYKQNFSPWSGKLEYLHENKKVKFVQQLICQASNNNAVYSRVNRGMKQCFGKKAN